MRLLNLCEGVVGACLESDECRQLHCIGGLQAPNGTTPRLGSQVAGMIEFHDDSKIGLSTLESPEEISVRSYLH